jgi:hypothetical protein
MDSYGSPGGDSSDQAFVIHRVWIGVLVELFGSLPLTTFSHPSLGSERYYCFKVSGMVSLNFGNLMILGKP